MGLWILLIAVAAATFFVIQSNRGRMASGKASAAVGKPAPQLDLVRLDTGEAIDFEQVAPSGSVVLLHFWGTWCGPCRMEYPHLAEKANELAANPGFRFLPVSCESGPGETLGGLAQKTTEYFSAEGITSPALSDPHGITRRSAAERLDQPSLYYPTSMLIGPDGKIVGVWEGYTPGAVDEIADVVVAQLESVR